MFPPRDCCHTYHIIRYMALFQFFLRTKIEIAHLFQSANKLKKKTKVEVLDSNLAIADLNTPGLLAAALEGMDSVVLCTSAVPKVGAGSCRGGFVFSDDPYCCSSQP